MSLKYTPTKHPNLFTRNGIYWFKKGRQEKSLKTKDEKEALEALKSFLLMRDEFKVGVVRLTMSRVSPQYLDSRELDFKTGKIRAGTLKETKYVLEKHLLPYFGKMKLRDIESPAWDKYRARAKVSDIANHRKVMAHFLKWCKKHGFRKYVPDLEINKHERRKRRILKPNEIKAIWGASEGSLRLFISMGLFLGMRRSEIMKLSWDRVDFVNHSIYLGSEHTKTKDARFIPIAEPAFTLLKERMLKIGGLTKWVFPSATNAKKHGDVAGLRKAWFKCLRDAFELSKDAPLPDITWHDLRATSEYYAHKRKDVASTQLEKFFGANVDVQRRIYVSMDADDVREVANNKELLALIEDVGKSRAKDEN